jgi:3-deoxy-D-manno-octulosonic acid kinase
VKARTHKQDSLLIVYDADCIEHPGIRLFDPEYWQLQGAVAGEAEGRGRALFLETGFGPAVLRRYLRGGWPARVSQDRYVFSGYERSRPVMEFNMLKKLSAAGLPVPEPLAAMCRRQGAFYTGWLMTRRIMDVSPLADLLRKRWDDPVLWRGTGACIRRFHEIGLVHADLNARNILVGGHDCVHLIDFDRARIREHDSRAFDANLRRLHRSLEKLWPENIPDGPGQCWRSLEEGYGKELGAQ